MYVYIYIYMYSFTYTQYYCIYVSQSSQLYVIIIITTVRRRCIGLSYCTSYIDNMVNKSATG